MRRDFEGLDHLIKEYAKAARCKCETLRTDDDIFDIWADFVVAGEAITDFEPAVVDIGDEASLVDVMDVKQLLKSGVRLIAFITRARTPMPKSSNNYQDECDRLNARIC